MLPEHPETIKRHAIFHGNINLVQHTAQHMRNSLTLPYLELSAMLEVTEWQRKNT